MITAKFGGTAVTPANLKYLKSIVTDNHNCVVVSAIGKTHPTDTKITDLLKMYYVDKNPAFWKSIQTRYKQLALTNCIDVDVEKLLFDARMRIEKHNLDYCMSLGEELSAKLVSVFLGGEYLEAQQLVVFNKTKLNYKKTISNLKVAFSGVKLGVMGGFYGGWLNTRKVFSRGGSDVTGSLCAVATNATLYENWTDVNGICQANPTDVANAKALPNVSYQQMYLMAKGGVTALHPDCVTPVEKHSIPIKIGNFFQPFGKSTIVSNTPCLLPCLGVTQKKDNGVCVTTVLHNMTNSQVAFCLHRLAISTQTQADFMGKTLTFPTVKFIDVSFQPNVVVIKTEQSILTQTYNAFCI